MAAFLVTGNPGSGKSALAQELARRGVATIDPDYDPELSFWEDDTGAQVLRTAGPATPKAAVLLTSVNARMWTATVVSQTAGATLD